MPVTKLQTHGPRMFERAHLPFPADIGTWLRGQRPTNVLSDDAYTEHIQKLNAEGWRKIQPGENVAAASRSIGDKKKISFVAAIDCKCYDTVDMDQYDVATVK